MIMGAREGMELARDRRWRPLQRSGDQLLPVTGADGVWYLSAENPNDMVASLIAVVRIFPPGAAGATGYPVQFLQNPTSLRLGGDAIYAWLGE